jgi:hypothetical protein
MAAMILFSAPPASLHIRFGQLCYFQMLLAVRTIMN